MKTYQQLLSKLLQVNLHGGIKLGLENSLRLNKLLNNPVGAFPAIHIAGTNGKGSVSTKIATALEASGKKVGLYTSPHISCFRERIRINDVMIAEEKVAHYLSLLFSLTEKEQIPATFFELTTLMAFKYFADQKIDVGVIETGLGGRLDATNIVQPILTVITSISLEHTEVLGDTLEQITREKAGIIKPKVLLVIGSKVPYEVVAEIAQQNESPLHLVKGQYNDYFEENEAIAQKALQLLNVSEACIAKGIKAVPACRLETFFFDREKTIILDVAHNPDGITALKKALQRRYSKEKFRFILGLSSNKDLSQCLSILKNIATCFHLVEAKHSRAASKESLKEYLLKLQVPSTQIMLEPSITAALLHARSTDEIVVICGTFFIMQEARQALGIQEASDPTSLNER